jgi:UDP-glucose 4-epimerase
MANVLITGIAGSLARLTAMEVVRRGHGVLGVDYRAKPTDFPKDLEYVRANYNKTRIGDAFRRFKPEIVIHLGRVGNLRVTPNKRFDLNVLGSAKLHELAVKYGVRRLVVLSTFHIYGAHPHNHIPIQEDEPLRAYQTVPKLADAIQLDSLAVQWIYRDIDLPTVVLRPTNVIGAHVHNTLSQYLRMKRIPYMLGFNPVWQFIHETDLLRAILLAVDGQARGVYNIAGRGEVPIVDALRLTEATLVPLPQSLASLYLRFAPKGYMIPEYLIDFLKYPVVIDDEAFRRDFGYQAQVGAAEAVRSCVTRMPLEAVLA